METVQRDRDATRGRLLAAVATQIGQAGFGSVGVNAVARRASVDKVLIYRYFGGLPGLLAAYGEEGDFWWQVDDLLAMPLPGPAHAGGLSACLGVVFSRHLSFLRRHPVTLEVIAWELTARNELTVALERVRESRSREAMRRLANRFARDEADFLHRVGPVLALLGGAANYLAARGRRPAVFNGMDLQSDAAWETLQHCARLMIEGACHAGPPAAGGDTRTDTGREG